MRSGAASRAPHLRRPAYLPSAYVDETRVSAYADAHGNDSPDRRRRRQQRPRCRAARGRRPSCAGRTAGAAPGPAGTRTRLVLAGHRRPPRRHQADRPPQVRPSDREAMMFERFTDTARQIVVQAQAAAGEPASAVLRDHGVTPDRVEAEILRTVGRGQTADPLGGLDRQALAFIGIDLDVVRARIEAAFGPDALTGALPAACRSRRPAWGKGPLAELTRRRRARRNAPLPAAASSTSPWRCSP